MHLALCDDEQYQLDHIVTLLEEYREKALPSLRWTTFLTGGALLTAMEQGQHFDAALLDIFMRDLNGMEVARYIRSIDSSIRLLFITSSSDFAVESYRVDASDYLLKPITAEALFSSLDKLVDQLKLPEEQGLVVRDAEGGLSKVLFSHLVCLEAMGHFTVLYRANGSSVRVFQPFSALAAELEQRQEFIQIHRSYIINLRYVHRMTKNEVFLLNGTSLPLSRSHQPTVTQRFLDYSFWGVESC
ncbi:MAG: response regulator transcription factor [Oscillospiraceae bacterium]|nr:response regulator transcription factor [Oscillospiraceae bacterium]